MVLNSAIVYFVEAYFIRNFTIAYDKRTENNKILKFESEMEDLFTKKGTQKDKKTIEM